MRKPYLRKKTNFSRNTQVRGEANGSNQLMHTRFRSLLYIAIDSRYCKWCNKLLLRYTRSGRIFKSEFCNPRHRANFNKDLKRTKPKVWRGVRRAIYG